MSRKSCHLETKSRTNPAPAACGQPKTPAKHPVYGRTLAKALAQSVFWGATADPTAGALWYHADYVKPRWAKALSRGPKIGRHIFYVDNPVTAWHRLRQRVGATNWADLMRTVPDNPEP